MSYQSENRRGQSRRRERSKEQDHLNATSPTGHKKRGDTESLATGNCHNVESTTLNTVGKYEDSVQPSKFLEVVAETEAYPPSVANQMERARSQNLVQLHCTARMDGFHQDLTYKVEFP